MDDPFAVTWTSLVLAIAIWRLRAFPNPAFCGSVDHAFDSCQFGSVEDMYWEWHETPV
jgi:hypothetical protein